MGVSTPYYSPINTGEQAMNAKEIGNTIWRQIPVGIKMSVGAREAMIDNDGSLHFRVSTSSPRKHTKIIVTLNGLDLYDVRLVEFNRRTLAITTVKESTNLYNDQLGEAIYRMVCD